MATFFTWFCSLFLARRAQIRLTYARETAIIYWYLYKYADAHSAHPMHRSAPVPNAAREQRNKR
jgi:hypothetical protein